jgi:hypothetical protein
MKYFQDNTDLLKEFRLCKGTVVACNAGVVVRTVHLHIAGRAVHVDARVILEAIRAFPVDNSALHLYDWQSCLCTWPCSCNSCHCSC